MKIYNTSIFRLYEKDFEGNWDYCISSTPLTFQAIEGVLQLNYIERMRILEIIEGTNGIASIILGSTNYGFEYVGETVADYKYRLVNARFEDISATILPEVSEKKSTNIAERFIKKAKEKKED